MKKNLVGMSIVLFVAVLVFSACTGPAKPPVQQQEPDSFRVSPPSETAPELPDENLPDLEAAQEITDESLSKLESNLKDTPRFALSQSYAQLSQDAHHTFAVGFTNLLGKEESFILDVKFKKAYDRYSNPIPGVSASSTAAWLSQNDFQKLTLQKNEKRIAPVTIKVLPINGNPAPKGTYVFELDVYYYQGLNTPEFEYSGPTLISVQVV